MNFLQFLQNDDNQASSGRLALLVWTLTLCYNWLFACYAAGAMVPIPKSAIVITTILYGGKVAKDKIEQIKKGPGSGG